MTLRYEEVAELIRIIDASGCDELILETDDFKLVVRRRGASLGASALLPHQDASQAHLNSSPTSISPPRVADKNTESLSKPQAHAGEFEVRAPMVGTFYRAPSPGARPFIEVGDEVQE